MRKKNKRIELQDVAVTDYAAEGKALTKVDGKVIFISGAVPGDTVDLLLTKNKKDWAEARVTNIKEYAKERVTPFCRHFGVCGGCKWQMLPYEKQLIYKQQEAEQNLRRIGKVSDAIFLPIVGAAETRYYRNKLEFTFSNKRYLLPEEIELLPQTSPDEEVESPAILGNGNGALGFHVPRIFDKA
ncbi:MAG: 23S rRNA (uracil-5-)-methyltransferase RumA, partial [Chitinophagaceae bacterium]